MSDGTHLLFLRNVLTSWVTRVLMLAMTFLVTPFVVHGLGKELYGLWAIGFTLMGYFTLLDVGVNGGLVSMISAAKARGEEWRIPGFVGTALVFYTLIGITLLAAVYLLRVPISHLFGVPASLDGTAGILFVGVTIYLIIVNLTGVFSAVVNAVEAIHISSVLNLGTATLNAVALIVVVVFFHGGIADLMLASIAVATATLFATWFWALRLCPAMWFRRSHIGWIHLKDIASLSIVIQVSNIAGVVNASVDKLIVAGFIGLASAGVYDLGSRLTVLIWTMSWLVASSAFPTASRLAQGSTALVRTFYIRAERYLVITLCGLSGLMFVTAPWLVAAWLGPGYGQVVLVTRVLAIATAGVCMSHVARVTMWSLKRSSEVLKFEFWRGLMHLGLSTLLVWRIGFNGGLIGAAISLTLPSAWLVWVVHRRLEVSNTSWLRSTFLPPLVGAIAGVGGAWLLVGSLLAHSVGSSRWDALFLLVAGCALYTAVYVAVLLRFGVFEDEDLAAFRTGRDQMVRWVRGSTVVVR